MKDSRLKTISVPQMVQPPPTTGQRNEPFLVAEAGTSVNGEKAAALRVVVRNHSYGGTIHVAYTKDALLNLPEDSDAYELIPGASDTFIVAPLQKVYVASVGFGNRASIAISDAIPIEAGGEKGYSA